MARNYSLVVNSRFKPFTYDDFMKPILLATQAHRELEDAYSTLSSDTEELEKMLDANRDKMSYATYQNYIKQVNALADELNQKGLTANSRRSAIKAKDDYHQKIVPIKAGYNRRAEAEKAQQAMLSQDPTRLYARRASELSVDDYVNDQTLDVLSENYSGALLAKQVADQATQYVKWAKKNGQLRNIGLPYIYEQKITSGASPEEVFAAMREDPNALPFLQKVVNNVMESSGIANWTGINGDINNRIYQEALGYAKQGLPAFIGTNIWKDYTDQYNMQLALLKQKQRMASGTPPEITGGNANWNPMFSTDAEGLKNAKDYLSKGWVKKKDDGTYEVTKEGKKHLLYRSDMLRGISPFGKFVGYKEGFGTSSSDKQLNDAATKAFSAYDIDGTKRQTDAYRINKIDHYLDPDMSNRLKRAYIDAGISLSPARYLNAQDGYQFGSAENPNAMEDVDWEKWSPTNIYDNKFGSFIVLQDDKGNRKEYRRPIGVNSKVEETIDYNNQQIWELQSILNSGYEPKIDNEGNILRNKNGVVLSNERLRPETKAKIQNTMENFAATNTKLYPNIPATWGINASDYKVNREADVYPDLQYAPYNYGNTGSYLDLLEDN